MGLNIGMVSLGCAKNQTDAEIMLGLLAEEDYKLVADPAEADVIIINTCAFIDSAKQESINTILEMAQYKEEGRCRLLIATGCLSQRYKEEVLKEMPEVDYVVGTGEFDRICEFIKEAERGERRAECGSPDRTPDDRLPRILTTPPYTAYLKISDGCDNNCTYCAIPMIRGRFRSRPMENIVYEAKSLAENGVKELILIAQDTTRYGIDIYGRYALSELLEELVKINGIEWIRVHYFYPEAVTEELIDTMARHDKICNYIDMPVQHSDDYILRRMARRTNEKEIREKIAMIRKKLPDAVIRTSIIAGFPGESNEAFKGLCEFVRDVRFDRMGVFAYSREEGTAAAGFDDQIPEETKQQRLDELMTIQQEISLELNKKRVGSVLEVIAEGYDEESFLFYGRSRGDSIDVDGKVYFGSEDEVEPGDIINVEILDAAEYDLMGKRV
ncbi:MAG TPA: 30S ribosomal protein S12 methylthiotransferase RimO [Candidatus Ornithomonoglobus intestinigallinarum]|uniref:Ribosomal protein uS12 methylthiotransferase RimO n=1 Tax=Candidatus Ornithomonoglobus intestinigallinarum TaxID=2840894 RepID=A0A9D1KPL6_9FIRM|nr:30S ribosomal protein S12 methylthiotransferase RimO [Candidatus Ornithomonoglobus intestinigallinarum]